MIKILSRNEIVLNAFLINICKKNFADLLSSKIILANNDGIKVYSTAML